MLMKLGRVLVAISALEATVVRGQPSAPSPNPAAVYTTAEEAFAVGAAHRNAKNYAAAESPFEEALRLSDEVAFRVKTYQALIPSYRLHDEIDDLATAAEYVVENGTKLTDWSNAANALLAYARERSGTDEAAKRLEQRLENDPNDRAALFLLSEIYGSLKRDPRRRVELLNRFIAREADRGEPQTVTQKADRAQLYAKADRFREAAELYEAAAVADAGSAAWHWKEAAAAWLKSGDKERALVAAQASSASAPERRSELLTHFWHKGVADAFLEAGAPALAIPHYEHAIASAKVEGYRSASEAKLAEARKKAESP